MTEFQIGTPEYYRNVLTEPIFGLFNSVRFDFTSKFDKDKHLFVENREINDVERDSGTVTFTNLNSGKIYNGAYKLTFNTPNDCIIKISFTDFILKSDLGIGQSETNLLINKFDDMIKYLKNDFPKFN